MKDILGSAEGDYILSPWDGNILNGCMSCSLKSLVTFPEHTEVGKEQGKYVYKDVSHACWSEVC